MLLHASEGDTPGSRSCPQPVKFHPCRRVQPHVPSALRLPRLSPAAWPPLSTTHCRDTSSTWDSISFLPCCQRAHCHLTRVNNRSLPPTPCPQEPPGHLTTLSASCFRNRSLPSPTRGFSSSQLYTVLHPISGQSKPSQLPET